MSVIIRFQPFGRKRQRHFRFAVQDKATAINRKVIAYLGHYDPRSKEGKVDAAAFTSWVGQGAEVSESAQAAFSRLTGVAPAEKAAPKAPVKKPVAKKAAPKK